METDGRFVRKVEHQKDGHGNYTTIIIDKLNDGKVREKMSDKTLQEKDGSWFSRHRVAKSYERDSGFYSFFCANCQHASRRAFDSA